MRGVEQIPWLYDLFLWGTERFGKVASWRAWLVAGTRGRVLDLGTGSGHNLALLPPGSPCVAVDPGRQNLEAARRRGPGVALVRARAEALPFRSGAFDTVLGAYVLCSVADPPAALAEVARVLAPGGALRLLEHVRSRHPRWARFQEVIQPAWTLLTGGCHLERDTGAALVRAGFRVREETRRAKGVMLRLEAAPPASPPARPPPED
jgi:ubiquinone/menaquinone biosynthesis C-methylase UbiE